MNQRGFTLLEMLIAIAVLGMLIGLLDQGLAFAMHAVAAQTRVGIGADLPLAEATLRRLITHADPGIYPEPASLEGTATTLTMVTQVIGPDGTPRPVEASLFAAGGSLRLRVSAHRHVDAFGRNPADTAFADNVVLLPGVVGCQIDYALPSGQWRPSWSGDTLPALVRIRLAVAGRARAWPPIIIAPRLEASGQ